MALSTTLARRTSTLFLVLLLCTAREASGDSWLPPRTHTVKSADGRFAALVIPREIGRGGRKRNEGPPHAEVYEGDPGPRGKRKPLWKVALSNSTAPVEAFLTNDGRHLVTLDNWHNVGHGDDVVAFYARRGDRGEGVQVARHSLDQILSAKEQARVTMSVSSLWWRENAYEFLDEGGDGTYFCIWLGEIGRWAAWDAATGKQLDVPSADEALVRRWNEHARQWAVERLTQEQGDRIAALRFLVAARDPEAPKLIEPLLASADFSTGYTGAEPLSECFVDSEARREADRALALWEGTKVEDEREWSYVRLGTLEVTLRLDPPRKGKPWGLFVYLVPESVAPSDWRSTRPVHRLELTSELAISEGISSTVSVRFKGVTPGRYWVKAVLDGEKPFHKSRRGEAVEPRGGDLESTDRNVVEVKPGALTRYGDLKCERRLKDAL